MTRTEIAFIIYSVIILALMLATMIYGVTNKPSLLNVGSCVEKTAVEQGFTGTSKEKWDIFAPYCTK